MTVYLDRRLLSFRCQSYNTTAETVLSTSSAITCNTVPDSIDNAAMNGSRPFAGTMALPPIHDAPREAPYSPDLGSLKLPAVQTSVIRSTPQLPTLEPLPSLNLTLSNSTNRDPFVKPQSGDHAYPIPKAPVVTIPQRGSMVSTDSSSPTEVGSTMSYDDYLKRRDTNTTVDETDDRIAAEALCGLGHIGKSTRSPA